MATMRVILTLLAVFIISMSAPTFAQYEDDPFLEGFIGPNYTLPLGHLKNDLEPEGLKATSGIGFDAGIGYYYKPSLIIGGYFRFLNMGTEDIDMSHRTYSVGMYGKFLFLDIVEGSGSPYLRMSAGINFGKFATRVDGEFTPTFRELSYAPTPAVEIALGFHKKTAEAGAIYFEGAFGYDFTDGITGEFRSQKTEWGANNQYVIIRAGVLFNIGAKE